MNKPCIFCKIVNKQAEASIVYEDDDMLGFLNIQPVHTGETLLIPKKHIDHFTDVDDGLAGKMMQVAQKIGRNILREYRPERIGYLVHGYGVPHAHLIVVPQHHENDLTSEHFAVIEDGKIKFTVQHIPYPSREELDEVAKKIKVE